MSIGIFLIIYFFKYFLMKHRLVYIAGYSMSYYCVAEASQYVSCLFTVRKIISTNSVLSKLKLMPKLKSNHCVILGVMLLCIE